MPRAVCVVADCDLPAALPLAVCASHRDDVHRSLIQIAEGYDELLEKAVRGKGRSGQGHEPPSIGSDAALGLRTEIRDTLLQWLLLHAEQSGVDAEAARSVVEELDAGSASVIELTSYLEAAASWFLAHDAAADYVAEVQALARRAERAGSPRLREGVVIGRHGDLGLVTAADCPCRCHNHGTAFTYECSEAGGCWSYHQDDIPDVWDCDGLIWATRLDTDATCNGCGFRRPVAWWRDKWPWKADDELTDAEVVERVWIAFGQKKTEADVRKWRHRQKIRPGLSRYRHKATSTWGSVEDYLAGRYERVSDHWTARLSA